MPRLLQERLKDILERSTRPIEIGSWLTLTCFSLALPDLSIRNGAVFFAQFSTFKDAIIFFEPKIAPLVLICVTIFWFYRYKGAVTKELSLMGEAFEEEHAPVRLEGLDWHRLIPAIGYLLVGAYVLLVLLAPYISLYCAVALGLHATDMTGSGLVLQNFSKTIHKFPISSDDPQANFIARRREVLRDYYLGNPTLPRIGVISIVTIGALLISLVLAPNRAIYGFVAYGLMIANILVGEALIGSWRHRRDSQLDQISREEEDYNAGQVARK